MSELLQLTVEVSVTAQELRHAVIEVHPGVLVLSLTLSKYLRVVHPLPAACHDLFP